jgi:hypothetical protein
LIIEFLAQKIAMTAIFCTRGFLLFYHRTMEEKQQVDQHIVISSPKRTVRAILSAVILTCSCAYFFGTSMSVDTTPVRKNNPLSGL